MARADRVDVGHVEGNTAVTQALSEAGADVTARSDGGFTPLLFAVRHDQQDTLRALVAAGADVDDVLPGGMSALAVAALNAHYALAVWLLEQGADLKAVNEKGWTPLTMAEGVFYSNTGKRWLEIEKLLLELGARRRSP